jgi:transposase
VECGWSATRCKDGFFKRKYQNLITRRGKKKALVAVAHHMMIAAYFVIKNKQVYKEPLLHNNPKRRNRQIKNHLAKLKELGIEIEINQENKKIKVVSLLESL